ncbi:MAG: hypothetical protein ACFFAJ_09230 [Candidatus Hodarchaeota archaeon]
MKKLINNRLLKLAFLIGGIYDLILGIGVIFFSDLLVTLFNLTKPNNMLFVHLTGIFLIIMGYFQIYALQDVQKLAFIGFGAIIVRFCYAFIVFFSSFTIGIEQAYLLTALTDILTGLLLLIPLMITEGISIQKIWEY